VDDADLMRDYDIGLPKCSYAEVLKSERDIAADAKAALKRDAKKSKVSGGRASRGSTTRQQPPSEMPLAGVALCSRLLIEHTHLEKAKERARRASSLDLAMRSPLDDEGFQAKRRLIGN
jgi:hypothetical protein